jgi:hypothetical protein
MELLFTPVHMKGVIKKIMRIPIETLLLVCLLIIVFFYKERDVKASVFSLLNHKKVQD